MKRVQRSRAKGARLPKGAVYVGRPTVWGNPWSLDLQATIGTRPDGSPWTADDVVRWFGIYATQRAAEEPEWLAPLAGRDLACWCPLDAPCHADVLLRLAGRLPHPGQLEAGL